MHSKLTGGILLIVGTSIGAGMLALPIVTAKMGFLGALILLIICWSILTAGAFLIAEVNSWLPLNSNLISMAGATLGPLGQGIAWVTYLLLLYSLLSAYISGGSDLLHNILNTSHIYIKYSSSTIIFTLLFGGIVFLGIKVVDYVNRALMFSKFTAYALLIILLAPFVYLVNLKSGLLHEMKDIGSITVTITSFGYALIIPSLRIYFDDQKVYLKKAILIGSLIPLICYVLWDAAIMGVIPFNGPHSLGAILNQGGSTAELVNALIVSTSSESISVLTHIFTSICMLTSFLGVSLCLVDFLSDGLHLAKEGLTHIILHLITFIPPLIIVLFYPKIFLVALQYAGIYCVILLILLPAMMAWRGRYVKKIAKGDQLFGGKFLLIILMIISLLLIFWGLEQAL